MNAVDKVDTVFLKILFDVCDESVFAKGEGEAARERAEAGTAVLL